MSHRGRYAVTFVFTLGLVALALGTAGAGELPAESRDPARFGDEAVALHAAGWTVGGLEIVQDDAHARVHLTLVDAARTQALRLALVFDVDGEVVQAYTRERAVVPSVARTYAHEDAIFDALRHGAVQHLYQECGNYRLELTGGEAELDELDWYVVERRVVGADAGAALAAELRAQLAGGAHVSDVQESEAGVAFVLVGTGHAQVVEARLDGAGRVVALEVREQPTAWGAGKLPGERRLARALRGRAVKTVVLSASDRGTRVHLGFTRGKGFVIDLATIEYEESEGCGC